MPCSLWNIAEGEDAVLESFAEDLPPAHRKRLSDLGFQPGVAVTCVTAPRFGAPRVYRVANTFYSLERTVAERMLATP